MRSNPTLRQDVLKYRDYIIIVEGKKDVISMNALGFERVYPIHITGKSFRERIEEIILDVGKKDRVCILTDFDKKGKQLYFLLKRDLSELGVRLDSRLRAVLLRTRLSHIEGLYDFLKNIEQF